ncbi:cathelicidin antimicrobial peptide-like [Macrotis lagotis]|uniref:cathelicidin antimicrobial peptide-like n=1 Tax=Macrotis lagotis TaxID=92651 RepID=UPI003D69BF32
MRMQRGRTMQISLSVLGLLSLMTPLASAQDPTYQDLVNAFINDYNRKTESENLFHLSSLKLQPVEINDPATRQSISFTIKETVCLKTENKNPDDCDFKENGVVKECIGVINLDSTQRSFDVNCDGPERIKRRFGRLKNIVRKAGRFLKNALKNVQIGFSIPIGR